MKLSTADFSKAVSIVAPVIERRTTIPVLSAMHLRAKGGMMRVTGTDLDVTCYAETPAETGNTVTAFAVMGADKIAAAARKLKAAEVEIGQDKDGSAPIQAGKLTIRAAVLPEDDFPRDGIADQTFAATLGRHFVDAVRQVAGAVSADETRYYLNGIYLEKEEGTEWGYRLVSTDGHRLHLATIQIPESRGALTAGVIIPRRAVQMLLAMADKVKDGPVTLELGKGPPSNAADLKKAGAAPRIAFSFASGDMACGIYSKLIDGTFPDYGRVIPSMETVTKKALLPIVALREAVEAVTMGNADKSRALKLAFDPESETALLSSYWFEDRNQATLPIPYRHSGAGGGIEIGFNSRYLLTILASLGKGAEEVLFCMSDASSPTIVLSPETSETFRGILMPMRV